MKHLLLLLFILLGFQDLKAQQARILELGNQMAYELIDQLIQKGHMKALNPNRLPYTHFEVFEALEAINSASLSVLEIQWVARLYEEIQFKREDVNRDYIITPYVRSGAVANDTERMDVYRATSTDYHLWPFTDLAFFTDFKNITLNTNVRFDTYYEFGPDGLDATNRLYMRNEDSYLGFSSPYIKAYIGRFEHNWGLYNRKSTFITPNANTFDQINFTIGNSKISYQTIFGFLDELSSDDRFDGNSRGDAESQNRYLSLKRIDWKINDHWRLSFKDGILYGGHNTTIEPKYLVPSMVYFFLEGATPMDQTENLFLGTSIWFSKDGFTANFDFMLDDLIFNRDERGITEKNNFSAIFNGSYMMRKAPLRFNMDAEIVSYQAYNTDDAEGRHVYLKKGIASQFNDYIYGAFKVDYFAHSRIRGLRISPYVGVLLQGEQEIDQPFSSSYANGNAFEYVLTGTTEATGRVGVDFLYSPFKFVWIKGDLGFNMVENFNHFGGVTDQRFASMIEIGFKYQ